MARIFMRFPEGRSKALTLSYDDGVEQDVKLLEIMRQYGLKGTFNINSGLYAKEGTVYPQGQIHRRMTKEQITRAFKNSGQEIAVHAYTHPFLDKLPMSLVVKEIIEDRENLEQQFETIVRGMAYPFGTFNDEVVAALKACDIVYARTVISTLDFRIPKDWLRLTATCHHKAPELMELARRFVDGAVNNDPYLFYLWGHSYEFEADDNWHVIEEFSQYAGNREDVWYATNMEVYDYVKAYEQLIYSVNGKYIQNPSGIDVWVKVENEVVQVKAGNRVVL